MIEVEISDITNSLEKLKIELGSKFDAAITREVMGLEREIKIGAPVDTGRYRAAWSTEKYPGVWIIRNKVEYAAHLVYGTIHMGIKHNVRGVVSYWKNHTLKNALDKILK